jgi:hypothetical protein
MEDVLYKLYPLVGKLPSWRALIERISEVPDINETNKLQWKEAVEFLRIELGEGFFNNCGPDHPVYIKLTNAPWLFDDLIDFVKTLKTLKDSDSNYSYLISKIRPRKKCRSEGACFVEIASTYLRQGFKIKFLESNSSQKSPDIEITDPITNDKFFIEVSQINDSDDRKQISDEFRVISNTLLSHGFDLLYSYKQLKHLGKNDIKFVVEKIKNMKDEVAMSKNLLIFRNELIDLAIAHPDKHDDLMKWCKENRRDKGAGGLPVDYNDTRRILKQRKIYKKVKQIPNGQTGILYMPIQFLYFFCMNTAETAIQIMGEIRQYPNLLGVVLYAELGQPVKEEFTEVENTVRSIRMINGIARHLLFVFNYDFRGELKENTWQRIKKCF